MQLTQTRLAVDFPPGVESFEFGEFAGSTGFFNLITGAVALGVVILITFFMWAYSKPQIVPTKKQWFAESIYGFIRNSVTIEALGEKQGIRMAPYMATLFLFIAVTNLWGIIPGVQISPNSHIAFPLVLGFLSWVLYIYFGVRQHGFLGYLKHASMPPGVPWYMLFLLVPIEIFSNLILRPFTLALRLFANMFAGHLILLVFTLGGFALLNAGGLLAGLSVFSWIMAIAMGLFEFAIMLLQAYVFVLLSTMYIQESLAEEH